MIWTVKQYYLRKAINMKLFTSTLDLAIDGIFVQGVIFTIIFFAYLIVNGAPDTRTFIEGSIAGSVWYVAYVASPICYNTGPGGPITALLST